MTRLAPLPVYFARASLRGLRASPVTTSVSIATIGVALVLVGAFALMLGNMGRLVEGFGDALHVTVYLEDGLTAREREEIAARIATVEGVDAIKSVSKDEALRRFRQGVGRGVALLEGLERNPLPASLEVTLAPEWRTAEGLRAVVGSIDGLRGVAELAAGQDWVDGYARMLALLRGLALGVGSVLALAALLIVANTIRLAVFARRDELEILALVGASRTFVRIPLLLEGMLQGALGGALALLLLYGLYRLVLPGLAQGLALLIGSAEPEFFSLAQAVGLLGVGGALGVLGSAAALASGARA